MAEAYSLISVPRKSNNAGRATGKKNYIVLFRWDDVAQFTKDDKGVRVTAFQFAEGKTPIGIYATQSTINIYDTAEGQDNNEANKTTINLASTLRGDTLGVIAKSLIPETDDDSINTVLGLTGAGGSQGGGV